MSYDISTIFASNESEQDMRSLFFNKGLLVLRYTVKNGKPTSPYNPGSLLFIMLILA